MNDGLTVVGPYAKKALETQGLFRIPGGKGEIRTHGTPKRTLDFESSAFDHSATFPGLIPCSTKALQGANYSRRTLKTGIPGIR
jgi:hypothetical protein